MGEYKKVIIKSINEMKEMGISDKEGWFDSYSKRVSSFSHYLELITKYTHKESKICDIGSAPFVLPYTLKKLGHEVISVDIDSDRFNNLQKLDIDVMKLDIEKHPFPYPNNYFDVIVFNEVFEHLRINLIETMVEIHRIIKNDGVLIMSTPNLRSIGKIVSLLLFNETIDVYHEWNKINTLGHMGHVREYTSKEIVDFMGNIGFVICDNVYRGNIGDYSVKHKVLNLFVSLFPILKPNMVFILKKSDIRGTSL